MPAPVRPAPKGYNGLFDVDEAKKPGERIDKQPETGIK
jgi:hypothetical protein